MKNWENRLREMFQELLEEAADQRAKEIADWIDPEGDLASMHEHAERAAWAGFIRERYKLTKKKSSIS